MKKTKKGIVERFYYELWDKNDHDVAREILTPGFRFRGSLGSERVGIDAFLAYVDSVHAALGEYRCIIENTVEGGDQIAAKMKFNGIHRAEFFGCPATHRRVEWAGAAFFAFEGDHIASLWVLGDVDGLKKQLGATNDVEFK